MLTFEKTKNRPVNEWRAIARARAFTYQYIFRHAIITHAKLYMTG